VTARRASFLPGFLLEPSGYQFLLDAPDDAKRVFCWGERSATPLLMFAQLCSHRDFCFSA
jgi:hypothetical protein